MGVWINKRRFWAVKLIYNNKRLNNSIKYDKEYYKQKIKMKVWKEYCKWEMRMRMTNRNEKWEWEYSYELTKKIFFNKLSN